MNVDVLNRSGIEQRAGKLAIADCDIHPRTKGYKALYFAWPVAALAGAHRGVQRHLPPALGEGASLPEVAAERLPTRRLAAQWRAAGQRPGVHGGAVLDPNNVVLGILNPLTSGQDA